MKFMWQYGTSYFSKLGKPSEATHCWTCVSKYKCLFVMNIRITNSEVLLRIPKTLTLMFCSLDDWQYTTFFFLTSYAKFLRRTKAATTIQKYWRMYVVRRRYKIRRTATIVLQSYLRGYLARNRYRKVRCCFQVCSCISVIIFSVYTKYHRDCCGQKSHAETTQLKSMLVLSN